MWSMGWLCCSMKRSPELREVVGISIQTYPSATKKSPFLSTATDVGLQNRELSEPGTSLSPNARIRCVRSLSGENLKTYNKKRILQFLSFILDDLAKALSLLKLWKIMPCRLSWRKKDGCKLPDGCLHLSAIDCLHDQLSGHAVNKTCRNRGTSY